MNFQEELQLEAANEDHRLLRIITRETITSGVELIDFGLELGCPPSIARQKLHDHPRSLEMASYILAAEWWDSSDASREEKYGVLLETIQSMDKKLTAEKLENIVVEKGLVRRSLAQERIASCAQPLEVNPCTIMVPSPSDQTRATHLAICNEIDTGRGNSFNIVEIPDQDEEERPNSPNGAGNNSEENNKIQETSLKEVQGSDDVFEEAGVETGSADDIDVFDNTETEILEVEGNGSLHPGDTTERENRLDVEGSGTGEQRDFLDSFDCVPAATFSGDHEIHSVCHDVDYNLFHQEKVEPNGKKLTHTEKDNFVKRPFEKSKSRGECEGKFRGFNDDKYPDVSPAKKVSPDSGLFDLSSASRIFQIPHQN